MDPEHLLKTIRAELIQLEEEENTVGDDIDTNYKIVLENLQRILQRHLEYENTD